MPKLRKLQKARKAAKLPSPVSPPVRPVQQERAGERSGEGAHSVMPYIKSDQKARAAEGLSLHAGGEADVSQLPNSSA